MYSNNFCLPIKLDVQIFSNLPLVVLLHVWQSFELETDVLHI